MARSDLSLEAQIWKLWEIYFFATPHNFANGPYFVTVTQLWVTKTGSKVCCTKLTIYILSAQGFWGYLPRKKFPLKFSSTERFTKGFRFSLISLSVPKKRGWRCSLFLAMRWLPILNDAMFWRCFDKKNCPTIFLTMFWKSLNPVLMMHISDVFYDGFWKHK